MSHKAVQKQLSILCRRVHWIDPQHGVHKTAPEHDGCLTIELYIRMEETRGYLEWFVSSLLSIARYYYRLYLIKLRGQYWLIIN
jgi:hypothetical protein